MGLAPLVRAPDIDLPDGRSEFYGPRDVRSKLRNPALHIVAKTSRNGQSGRCLWITGSVIVI